MSEILVVGGGAAGAFVEDAHGAAVRDEKPRRSRAACSCAEDPCAAPEWQDVRHAPTLAHPVADGKAL